MKYKNTYQKICDVCGKPFETGRQSRLYCSDRCRYEKQLENYKEYGKQYRIRVKEEKPKPKKCIDESLAEVNARARAAGMSYGQYMLMKSVGRTANG